MWLEITQSFTNVALSFAVIFLALANINTNRKIREMKKRLKEFNEYFRPL